MSSSAQFPTLLHPAGGSRIVLALEPPAQWKLGKISRILIEIEKLQHFLPHFAFVWQLSSLSLAF